MLDLDIAQFWKDDAAAHEDNCFCKTAPQVALGIRMSDECVFAELGEEGEPWGYTPRERRIELNKRYNEKALNIVGQRLLQEDFPAEEACFPSFKEIGEVFGGQYVFDGKTTWLQGSCSTPKELEQLLNRIDRLNLREFILPNNWESEKKRLWEAYGKKPRLYTGIRGPVTLACSVYGVENLIYLLYDAPELALRFRDAIADITLRYHRIFMEEAGYTGDTVPHGFTFCDDDCCLLNQDLYEQFGYPILSRVFSQTAPNPGDTRYQHSDSAMEHLLPILGRLNLTGCNFGPTLTITEIRKYMPKTRIDGQIAPFTFMNNNEEAIIAEVKRDCEMAREKDIRGVNLSTAGSINNGSLLTSMRTVMAAIQTYGRY